MWGCCAVGGWCGLVVEKSFCFGGLVGMLVGGIGGGERKEERFTSSLECRERPRQERHAPILMGWDLRLFFHGFLDSCRAYCTLEACGGEKFCTDSLIQTVLL